MLSTQVRFIPFIPPLDNQTFGARAFHADVGLAQDPSRAFAQEAPDLNKLEVDRTYDLGNARKVDLRMTWDHTSRVADGATVMEYRYRSLTTGEIGPVDISPFPTEFILRGLPRENYSLVLELRYHWYNSRDPNAQVFGTAPNHILIKNPPGASSSECASENTDEWPGARPTSESTNRGDGIDATKNSDTNRPGCAFYLLPGLSRYSQWATIRIDLAGPLTGVPNPTPESQVAKYPEGLPAAIAEFFIVMGADPVEVGPVARTVSVLFWLFLACIVASLVYYGTGGKTGSLYAAAFFWFVIWTGLGPLVASIPTAMAFMPAAAAILLVAILLIKRGKNLVYAQVHKFAHYSGHFCPDWNCSFCFC